MAASSGNRGVLSIAFIVSLGGFLFGFDASVISGVVGFIVTEFGLNDWQLGLVVGAPTLGGVFAALIMGPLSDVIGRKKTLILIASLYTISAIFSALAPNYETLVVARFIGGLAFGSLMIAPIYIAEIARTEQRGRLVSINQLNIVIGFSAAYFANYAILQLSQQSSDWVAKMGIDDEAWRWMLGLEFGPALAYTLLLTIIPESPRWLTLNGRLDDATRVFKKLGGETYAAEQIEYIQLHSKTAIHSFRDRLSAIVNPNVRFILILGFIVGIAQQITGINAVYFYAPSIFEQSGVGTDAAFAQAIWIGIINIIFTLLSMALIDKIGRKPLMVAGLAGVMGSMLLTSYGFSKATYRLESSSVAAILDESSARDWRSQENTTFHSDVAFKKAIQEVFGVSEAKENEAALIKAAVEMNAVIVLMGILGFVASFAASLGPVMWVVLSEIFPNRIRGMAMAVVGIVNSGVSFLVQLVFPWELSRIGAAGAFLVYGSLAFLSLILVQKFLPETKGKSLEVLEEELSR